MYKLFTTDILTEPLTVTGDAMAHLFVSCDCPDTDFVFRITDVDENGRSIKLADGVLRSHPVQRILSSGLDMLSHILLRNYCLLYTSDAADE